MVAGEMSQAGETLSQAAEQADSGRGRKVENWSRSRV